MNFALEVDVYKQCLQSICSVERGYYIKNIYDEFNLNCEEKSDCINKKNGD